MVDCGECHCGSIGDRGLFSSVVLSQVLAQSRGHTGPPLRGTGSVSTRLARLALARTQGNIGKTYHRPEGLLGNTAAAHATSPRARCCVVELASLVFWLQTVGADPLPFHRARHASSQRRRAIESRGDDTHYLYTASSHRRSVPTWCMARELEACRSRNLPT